MSNRVKSMPCPLCGAEVEAEREHTCSGTPQSPGKCRFYFSNAVLIAPKHRFSRTEAEWRRRRKAFQKEST